MDKQTVNEMLENADRDDLIGLIAKLTDMGGEAERAVTDWCRKHNKKNRERAIEIELGNLWREARAVISEFNEYGGGPESDEEDACDNLWAMDTIVREHRLSWEIRREIVDEMLEEFYVGNSGFDDVLMEVADSFCSSDEEKRYLADKMAGGSSGYYKNCAADIYKSIGDSERFLQIKLSNLTYGSDYIDVARYYAGQGDHERELEYIWEGLERCKGRLDELIDYAAPVYMKKKNDKELKRLYKLAVDTKLDGNIAAIAKHLYRYSGQRSDYESKKKMLLLLLDTCDEREIKTWFQACGEELHREDWEREYESLLGKIRNRDLKYYLDICMETGREEEVLKYLQGDCRRVNDWYHVDYNQYFSDRLAEKYPDEILALWWRDVNNLLCVTNKKNYSMVAGFLKKIKALMKKNGRQAEWERKFAGLKEEHKRKKNFLAIVKSM